VIDHVTRLNGTVFSVNITHGSVKKKSEAVLIVEDNSSGSAAASIFQLELNFQTLNTGGFDTEFENFRRSFLQQTLLPQMIRSRGIKHLRRILLVGPPGTAKMLVARRIGKM
jgi:ATP-dependent 26S proteasome regulatory subunit